MSSTYPKKTGTHIDAATEACLSAHLEGAKVDQLLDRVESLLISDGEIDEDGADGRLMAKIHTLAKQGAKDGFTAIDVLHAIRIHFNTERSEALKNDSIAN